MSNDSKESKTASVSTTNNMTENDSSTLNNPINNSDISSTSDHSLENGWTLYYSPPAARPLPGHAWTSNVKRVFTFRSVEDFWRLYHNVKPASQLGMKTDFYLMKGEIEPEWEHEANLNGGKFGFTLSKKDLMPSNSTSNNLVTTKVDECWLNLVLSCIGETFTKNELVNGINIGMRPKEIRIAIWTKLRSPEHLEELATLGTEIKNFIQFPGQILFTPHDTKDIILSV